MAEIKHNFAGGKMNKDIDERLVPNGEYRDAMNIQVSTSEGADIGAIENLLSNTISFSAVFGTTDPPPSLSSNAICVGSVADEKHDAFYWFVMDPEIPTTGRNIIFRHQNNVTTYVFVDLELDVLSFSGNIITGINIIDDLLFWTDSYDDGSGTLIGSEPKVISISRSMAGTSGTGLAQTNFINQETGVIVPAREEHITVVKKSPKTVLTVETEDSAEYAFGLTISNQSFLTDPALPALGNVTRGSTVEVELTYDANSPLNFPLSSGTKILLTESGASILPPNDSTVVLRLTQKISSSSNTVIAGVYHLWEAIVVAIDDNLGTASAEYAWATKTEGDLNFLKKFPRFSYRYKYIDGEYSTFGPFTSVMFKPGEFTYDVKDAFNLGMENKITKAILKDYNTNLPNGVVSIDLLYKDSNSPTVHLIDTIYPDSNEWDSFNIGYEVRPNMIKAVLPENQLLRSWDNVPRLALAQDVVGSRIVYGNYLQNYTGNDYKISGDLTNRNHCDFETETITSPFGKKSLKSIRNYSLGISYLDKYGRQTPVFTNKTADINIPIEESASQNQIIAQPLSNPPDWATHYKVFIKETSNEYYNLAMDRIYEAKDGNVWLSFPSSDRNKIDEETFLILKKGGDVSTPITESNRYKVIAIENEAPDFIKTKIQFIEQTSSSVAQNFWFPNASGYPLQDYAKVIIDKDYWDQSRTPLTDIDLLSVAFAVPQGVSGATAITPYYNVIENSVVSDNASPPAWQEYHLILNKPIEETYLGTGTTIDSSLVMKIYKRTLENRPEFDGRFFVKIAEDTTGVLAENLLAQATSETSEAYVQTAIIPFYYLADGANPHNSDDTTVTSINQNGISDSLQDWQDNFDPSTVINSNSPQSMWFIDSAYYAGTYSNSYLAQEGMYARGPIPYVNNPTAPYHANSTHIQHPTARETGYNKGIYTDVNGQTWIDLSFGQIKASDAHDDPHMHTDGTDTGAIADVIVDSAANLYDYNVWTSYYQSLRDTDSNDDNYKFWSLGNSLNSHHNNTTLQSQIFAIQQNAKFRFLGDEDTIYTIIGPPEKKHHVNFMNHEPIDDHWRDVMNDGMVNISNYHGAYWGLDLEDNFDMLYKLGHAANKRTTWRIPIDKDPTDQNITLYNPIDTTLANATLQGGIQFVELAWVGIDGQVVGPNPAIWETEPKEDVDLDIYYETDSTFPLTINNDTNYNFAPIGTQITAPNSVGQSTFGTKNVIGWEDNIVELDSEIMPSMHGVGYGSELVFHRKDGSCVSAMFVALAEPILGGGGPVGGPEYSFFVEVNPDVSKRSVSLSWFNCYSFGNGVESNRIRDDYNKVYIDKGAKASSTIDEPYEEEHRKYGLIYSGLYNSTSGVNNLNQFIAAEKITKDINPIYGSIQKLHSRNTDLIALCEDKVLKILSNKDAVFNADNNIQLTATNKVLGQTVPFVGEYGISKNPESFASESYRVYFTDKIRGSVMRLSMDGLTPISMHGMKDWFKDNLRLNNTIIGSYDDKKGEYNVTLQQTNEQRWNNGPITVSFREDVKGWVSFKSFVPENGISCANEYYTFDKGIPWRHHIENIDRNTFYNIPYDSSVTLLLNQVPGSVKSFTTLNYEGSQTKIDPFVADPTTGLTDGEYWNLNAQDGWYVDKIFTDLETGSLNEFIEKEGKWFNYIKGTNVQVDGGSNILINSDGSSTFDQASFAIQGLGILNSAPVPVTTFGCMDPTAFNFDPNALIPCSPNCCVPVFMGCLEPSAFNWAPGTSNNTDDGSCVWMGCTCNATTYPDGCTNSSHPFATEAYTYVHNGVVGAGITDDGSCNAAVYGCTDLTMFNYNPAANINETSPTDPTDPCVPVVNGCEIFTADNYNSNANTDDGSCYWSGCTEPLDSQYANCTYCSMGMFPSSAVNYWGIGANTGIVDDGSCVNGGCTDVLATNYNGGINPGGYTTLWDDNSCITCDFTSGTSGYNGIPITTIPVDATSSTATDGRIYVNANPSAPYLPFTYTITDSSGGTSYSQTSTQVMFGHDMMFYDLPADTYTISLTGTPSLCVFDTPGIVVGITAAPILGCTNATACNYDSTANTDNGLCEWTSCAGCSNSSADNYNTHTGTTFYPPLSNPLNTPCTTWPSPLPSSCSISCGDGSNNTGWGDICCEFTTSGCTDATANNYLDPASLGAGSWTIVDDGSCTYDVYGCMDGGNCSVTTCGYVSNDPSGCTPGVDCNAATNYNSLATIDDGSCLYTIQVPGCTDATACNFDQFATQDDGSCVYGFHGVAIGDPLTTDEGGNIVSTPVFFDDANTPVTSVKHFMFQTPSTMLYTSAELFAMGQTYTYGTQNGTPINYYPFDTYTENDLGLRFGVDDISIYGSSDEIIIELYKANPVVGNPNILVHSQAITDPSFFSALNSGLIYGNRANSLPYGFGGSFGIGSLNNSNNYNFNIYKANGSTKEVYTLLLKSVINGVTYGTPGTALANCGHSHQFSFTTLQACDHPAAVIGCTDPMACNYDPAATCHVPCLFPTIPNWYWSNDPSNQSQHICQHAPCTFGAGNPPTVYSTLNACCAAHPGSPSPCPQS